MKVETVTSSWNPIYTRFWLHELPDQERRLLISLGRSDALLHDIHYTLDLDDPSVRGRYLNFWMVVRIFLLVDVGSQDYIRYKKLGIMSTFEDQLEEFLVSRSRGEMCLSSLERALVHLQKALWETRSQVGRSTGDDYMLYSNAFVRAALWANDQLTHFGASSALLHKSPVEVPLDL